MGTLPFHGRLLDRRLRCIRWKPKLILIQRWPRGMWRRKLGHRRLALGIVAARPTAENAHSPVVHISRAKVSWAAEYSRAVIELLLADRAISTNEDEEHGCEKCDAAHDSYCDTSLFTCRKRLLIMNQRVSLSEELCRDETCGCRAGPDARGSGF